MPQPSFPITGVTVWSPTALAPVAAWLAGRGDVPGAELLRAAGLATYAYTALPADHPRRGELRPDYLQAAARFLRIKSALAPLLRAWERAGIRVLIFKGFHLSEFVYPSPPARIYADADVLLPPERTAEARRLAEALGWRVDYDSVEAGRPDFHTALELSSPEGTDVCVDAHRYVVGSATPGLRLKREVTRAVWERARERYWQGMKVWEMDPADALLVGVVLGRAWGADGWAVKPYDAVDWRMLRDAYAVDAGAVEARARELGCARTLHIFRERFDPDAGRLVLGAPPRGWVRSARARSAMECFQFGAAFQRARNLPRVAVEVVAMLPYVLRARRAVRRMPDLRALLQSLTPARVRAEARATGASRFRTTRGVRWAARLLRTPARSEGLVRSLALYAALRDQGWTVSFVRGVRADAAGETEHAWLELDDRVLPDLREAANRELYRESFRYP